MILRAPFFCAENKRNQRDEGWGRVLLLISKWILELSLGQCPSPWYLLGHPTITGGTKVKSTGGLLLNCLAKVEMEEMTRRKAREQEGFWTRPRAQYIARLAKGNSECCLDEGTGVNQSRKMEATPES